MSETGGRLRPPAIAGGRFEDAIAALLPNAATAADAPPSHEFRRDRIGVGRAGEVSGGSPIASIVLHLFPQNGGGGKRSF